MQGKLRDRRCPAWLTSGCLAIVMGMGISAAAAQDPGAAAGQAASVNQTHRGEYYIEFRSRYSWDYGHTYIIHARVGEPLTNANVAGLSPVGEDATAWMIGHIIPVPSETGATDGDLDEKYVTARYRVYMSKAEYDRVMAHVRHLQATSPVWQVGAYNCNAFVADIAKFMGLRVPKSTVIYPRVFVSNLRQINTHPELADTLFEDNRKEMSSPTRDGRAMINNGVYAAHEESKAAHEDRKPSAVPTVTIGSVRATNNRPANGRAESVAVPNSAPQ